MAKVHIGPYTVDITNRDRVLFPDEGITKGELVDYYRRIADTMLPHLEDRPLNLQRFPSGIHSQGFFQQDTPDYFPEWIGRIEVAKSGGTVVHPMAGHPSALVYLANQSCIAIHVWLSRADRLTMPDRMVFDLDPSGNDFEPVREAALSLKDMLEGLGLTPFVKTTGSRGLHVAVPLDRSADFDSVREFAGEVARSLAERSPKTLTTEQRKSARRGRMFLDTVRNSYGQTFVAPYSVRAKPGAPVSAPIAWDELFDRTIGPASYTLRNIFEALEQRGDPWTDMDEYASDLAQAEANLR